jgi:cobalt-precorrin 5A hydrolase
MKRTAVFALTPQGAALARTLADGLEADLFLPRGLAREGSAVPFERLADCVAGCFSRYERHVFVAAAGIAVRVIAPHLKAKDRDPAVVVLDQEGRHAVSLLSGHLGGANELALEAARLTGGQAVITTATDTAGLPSADLLARDKGLYIENPNAVKTVNMAILRGETLQVFDPDNRLGLRGGPDPGLDVRFVEGEDEWDNRLPGIWVTWKAEEPGPDRLLLRPRCLVAGVGCNRGTEKGEILDMILGTFNENGLSMQALACLATIEAKRDEAGLLETADELGVPLVFYTASQLENIDVPHPSGVVQKHMGVASVCEAAALLKTKGGRFLIPKIKRGNVTLAVALEG